MCEGEKKIKGRHVSGEKKPYTRFQLKRENLRGMFLQIQVDIYKKKLAAKLTC